MMCNTVRRGPYALRIAGTSSVRSEAGCGRLACVCVCVRLIRQFFQWVVVFEHTIDIVWGGRPSRRVLEDRGDGRPHGHGRGP